MSEEKCRADELELHASEAGGVGFPFFRLYWVAHGILIPQPGIEPMAPYMRSIEF